MIGATFGSWRVLAHAPKDRWGSACVFCVCACGVERVVVVGNLTRGGSRGCGCSRRLTTRHGESHSTKEYRAWCSLNRRCRNRNTDDYRLYGARGIRVCERWRIYENFLADMGRAPSAAHSIDRIDVNGDYEPGNCRWATPVEQVRNRRVRRVVRDDGLTLSEAAAIAGVSAATMWKRLRRGWSIDRALAKG